MKIQDAITIGAGTIVVLGATLVGIVLNGKTYSDPACYSIIDRAGVEHPSYYHPTTDGTGTLWVYKTEEEWGYVFGASSTNVDRDCLRERGVPVKPLQPEEEAPN